jgi:FeS assembly SUF system regulator
MLRMSKLTDYALVLLTHMAQDRQAGVRTAQELALASRVPLPTVAKILKELSKAGVVASQRGRHGGYTLARPADQISVASVVEALEGPVSLTECSTDHGDCSLQKDCVAKDHWGPISRAIQRTLSRLPLSALGSAERLVRIGGGRAPALRARVAAGAARSTTEISR